MDTQQQTPEPKLTPTTEGDSDSTESSPDPAPAAAAQDNTDELESLDDFGKVLERWHPAAP